MRYSVQAIWQASMLTSSLLVSATRMSVPAMPGGLENARARRIAVHRANVEPILQIAQDLLVRVDDGDVVRLFAREVICRRAADLSGAQNDDFHSRVTLHDLEIGVRQHQPLRALPLEIDLDAGMRPVALEIEHHAVAELRMPDPAAHAHAAAGGSSRLLLRLTNTGRDTCRRGRISSTSSGGSSLMKRDGWP